MGQGHSKDTERHIQAGVAALCLLLTIIISILLLIVYWAANNIYRRQIRLKVLVSYLNYTAMKQNFPSGIFERMLAKVGYDYEKLENDRNEFMKWCADPKGVSYRQPDDIFTPAAADDKQYDTIRDMDQKAFWKVEQGSASGTISGQATKTSDAPMPNRSAVVVPSSIRTSFTQPDADDGLYDDPAVDSAAIAKARKSKKAKESKKSKTSSVKTSYTQEDDGLYENVEMPVPPGSKTRKTKDAKTADGTSRSESGSGSRQADKSKSRRTAVSDKKVEKVEQKTKTTSTTSNSTESGGAGGRKSARTAYNSGDGDYENLENLQLD